MSDFREVKEVKVQGQPPPQQYAAGRLLGYRVYYREYTSSKSKSVKTSSANVTMVILRDLKQATTYKLTVAAFTSKGEGPTSYGWRFMTTGDAFSLFIAGHSLIFCFLVASETKLYLLVSHCPRQISHHCVCNITSEFKKAVEGYK